LQTLKELTLWDNQIDDIGARYLREGLQQNTVTLLVFSLN